MLLEKLILCVGQEAGIEAVLHSLNLMYNNKNNDALLMVHASNTFN